MQQLSLIEDFTTPPAANHKDLLTDLMNERIPFHAAEALIEDYLLGELSEFEMLDVKADPVSDINCKWRYSSACQKFIRRGFVSEAIRCALTYHSVDPSGFWNRLVIIAFEDIGVGDIWTVAMTLAAAKSSIWRRKAGGDELVIQFIIKKMAEGVKDRTVCDFFQVLENRSIVPTALSLLKSATPQKLSSIALSGEYPFDTRTSAAWMLWGTSKLKNPRLPSRTGERDLFEETIERLGVPGIVKYITLRGMIACRCAMNLVYAFTYEMMKQSPQVKLIATALPEPFYIKGLPCFTFDKHTREGKSAYKYFYQSCHAVSDFLTSKGIVGNDEILSAIGISVFITESALLNMRVDFVGAERIYQMTVEDDYRKNGLTLEDGLELSRLIQENHEALTLARIRVVGGK
jgi:hypothetical protein